MFNTITVRGSLSNRLFIKLNNVITEDFLIGGFNDTAIINTIKFKPQYLLLLGLIDCLRY